MSTPADSDPTTKQTTRKPSKGTLVAAARLLIESESDDDFPAAEIMLRNILIERATADAASRLDKIKRST
jgi:hypothetical protein